MREVRRDADIHEADGGWFRARWHFRFDHYHDSARMGLGPLWVFNTTGSSGVRPGRCTPTATSSR